MTTIGWTAALWLLGSLLLHADAPAPPVVASVIVSSATTPQQITITGSDFGNVMPSLSMDGFDLHVTNFTSTVVRAELPALITSHPGTYVLTLDKNSGPPPFRTVSIDVAIGAVGPQGPPGGTGLPGPQGAQGPPGPNVLAPGSAAAPSLSFAGDAATGFFSAGINTVNITTMGTNRLTIRPDGDLDLPGSIRKNGSLFLHNLGSSNTAIGVDALSHDTSGSSNSAVGREALAQNTTGASNTAVGTGALGTNKGGGSNTAVGVNALAFIATGDFNTALGKDAMFTATGSRNIALGDFALGISTGDRNIAIGDGAGALLTSGHDNVYIANSGAASESNTIRLGLTQNRTFVAGVAGTALSNSAPVLIDTSTGQLGTLVSSRRYKEDIQDMGDASANLQRLRPVTFHYRNAPAGESKPLEYGLIAEEVEETYPDLVAHGSEGQVETVQYHKLIPMLLNELQKQARVIRWLEEKVEALEAQHSNGFAGRR